MKKLLLALLIAGCNNTKEPPPKAATNDSSAPVATTAPTDGDPLVGKPAPDFTAINQDGKEVKLSSLKGKPVVLYFYPKDETPGCTKEACSFRDAWNELSKTGVVMLGVSTDSAESHKKFIEHHKLPFELLSDPKGELARSYGVPVEGEYIKRHTIVIDKDGVVKKAYRKVDVSVHAQEILADLRS
jgi:peroxiredoxin Q/BCP